MPYRARKSFSDVKEAQDLIESLPKESNLGRKVFGSKSSPKFPSTFESRVYKELKRDTLASSYEVTCVYDGECYVQIESSGLQSEENSVFIASLKLNNWSDFEGMLEEQGDWK